ncbi:MAG: transglycosylase SLT domain-containing protein [Dechloromonas sp.]|jgi:soluble lytic murein transglycosylase-like protein|nr:transglycosylase SLT domain-containing protein [Dechloromonas sp.]
MIATAALSPNLLRATSALLNFFQAALMAAGTVLIIGLVSLYQGQTGIVDGARALLPEAIAGSFGRPAEEPSDADRPAEALTPRMRSALDYVSRRYRVSTEALEPIFVTAQATGRDLRLDPLLIIAVIGVESGFNPLSQSTAGAQGLMQVMPRYHKDKLPEDAGNLPFLDPLTNVQVGARVLKDSIQRYGGVTEGLQQFGGALSDPDRRYSGKVLAEKQRLEQAALRLRGNV